MSSRFPSISLNIVLRTYLIARDSTLLISREGTGGQSCNFRGLNPRRRALSPVEPPRASTWGHSRDRGRVDSGGPSVSLSLSFFLSRGVARIKHALFSFFLSFSPGRPSFPENVLLCHHAPDSVRTYVLGSNYKYSYLASVCLSVCQCSSIRDRVVWVACSL